MVRKKVYSWLSYSGGLLRLDVAFFVKNMSWISLAQIVNAMLSFVLAAAFARYFTQEQYGIYVLVQSVLAMFSFLGLASMGVLLIKAVSEGDDKSLARASGVTLHFTMLGSIGIFLFGIYFFVFKSYSYMATAFLIGAVFFPLIHSFNYFSNYFVAKRQFLELLVSMLLPNFFSVVLIVPILLVFPSPWLALFVSLLVVSVTNIYFTWRIGAMPVWRNYLPDLKNKLILLGVKLSLFDAIVTVSMHADKVLIGALLPLSQLAQYSFAIMLPEFIKGVVKQLEPLALSKMAEQGTDNFRKSLLRHTALLLLGIAGIVGTYIIVVPVILPVLFPKYSGVVAYSQVYMLSIFSLAFMFVNNYFRLSGDDNSVLQTNLVYFGLTVSSLAVLIPLWGVWGVVFSRLITRIGAGVFSLGLFVVHKERGFSVK